MIDEKGRLTNVKGAPNLIQFKVLLIEKITYDYDFDCGVNLAYDYGHDQAIDFNFVVWGSESG